MAENKEEAYLKAKEDWNRVFGENGLFGEVEFVQEVKE